ncbi:hypothetical protein SDC9_114659 [bioreactor metagenome]|uniref:Polysaccharide pyruvyl transferase domain-containing protein n=1 Tax=bioreactor metagenome TaxID=1076179 RepID=A0A645BR04_9ZZZZ
MITCAEPAPISRFSFDRQIGRIAKIKAHREFFGKVLNVVLESYDFSILFLPHTIGPTKDLDDRIIAKDIISHSNHKNSINGRCYVLEEDLNACQLKGIISMGSIMIAERVHSVIGAIGVHTPFLCFASNKDNRVSGMIKEMANLGDNIFYLNTPNIESCIDSFDKIYKNRIFEQQKLIKISNSFQKELDIIGNRIKLQILNSINN